IDLGVVAIPESGAARLRRPENDHLGWHPKYGLETPSREGRHRPALAVTGDQQRRRCGGPDTLSVYLVNGSVPNRVQCIQEARMDGPREARRCDWCRIEII